MRVYSEAGRIYIYNVIIITRRNDNAQTQEALFVIGTLLEVGYYLYIKAIMRHTGLSSYGEGILDNIGVNH